MEILSPPGDDPVHSVTAALVAALMEGAAPVLPQKKSLHAALSEPHDLLIATAGAFCTLPFFYQMQRL